MTGFFGGILSTLAILLFALFCTMGLSIFFSMKPSKRSMDSQRKQSDAPKTVKTSQYNQPEKPVVYGNISDFRIKGKTEHHSSFPIIPEDAEDRRIELRQYMIRNNLLIKNSEYYDVPNSMNYFRDVFEYNRTYIQGKLEAVDDSYFADEEEYDVISKTRYKVYASLDGKNWIDIGYAPSGKMWDCDFYNGMRIDVQLSGGNYKHIVNDKVVIGRKPYYFYGYFN